MIPSYFYKANRVKIFLLYIFVVISSTQFLYSTSCDRSSNVVSRTFSRSCSTRALSPSRAAPASLERPGTPPDKLGRASRLIRFASPVVAKSKVRTPSPAKEDGAMPAEASPEDGGAVGDDAQPGVGVSADDEAALSSDSDSDGWVTDEGSSEGSSPPPRSPPRRRASSPAPTPPPLA